MMQSGMSLSTLKARVEFVQIGDAVGNLTLGRGTVAEYRQAIHVAIIENKIASGSLGVKECDKLASLFKVIATTGNPLLLYIDSAGARVSEGLPALGAFRQMYRAALTLAASGAPFTVYCGTHCFGGASMLAALGARRVYAANTRLAMSGPAILAAAAGLSALDDMFAAMSQAAISGETRAKLIAGDIMAADAANHAMFVERVSPIERHRLLGVRLAHCHHPSETIQRKDMAKRYPNGYRLELSSGVLRGEAEFAGRKVSLAGFLDLPRGLLDAACAWRGADGLWKMLEAPPATLHLLLDCESHATSLADERLMLSSYTADLALALHALARAGTHIETTVLGKLGGGVYVALAAPVAKVNMLYGSEIQLLPGRAIASILGEGAQHKYAFTEYRDAGVADEELKLGIL